MTAGMASANGELGAPGAPAGTSRPISALPSVQARILAFAAIVVAGVSGGLIGFSAVKVGCQRNCATPEGVGGVVGAVMAAGGVAVIAVLVLRAMGEWRTIKEKRQLEAMIAAADEAGSADVPAPGDGGDDTSPSATSGPPTGAEPDG